MNLEQTKKQDTFLSTLFHRDKIQFGDEGWRGTHSFFCTWVDAIPLFGLFWFDRSSLAKGTNEEEDPFRL